MDAFRGELTVSSSGFNNIEITASGVDKGTGVTWLAQYVGIPMEQVMVMGDNLNDVSMFQQGCLNVAMGNATPELKELAHHVTCTNMEDGVAVAVERFVLGSLPVT